MAESLRSYTKTGMARGGYQHAPDMQPPCQASPGAPPPTGGVAASAISRLVEAEVIPRLYRHPAHIDSQPPTTPAGPLDQRQNCFDISLAEPALASIGQREILAMATALLKQDLHSAWHMARLHYKTGMDVERIAIDLLGPTAAYLGELWDADRCSFADVTLGTGYLHQILRDLCTCLDANAEIPGYHHRVLLLPAPGEQHIFGLSVLGESFRRRGWDVCGGPGQDRKELLAMVHREHFDVLGFSVATERHLEDLLAEIGCFRRHSRNPEMCILVGGHAIHDDPALVSDLGADTTVDDARQAPDAALACIPEAQHG